MNGAEGQNRTADTTSFSHETAKLAETALKIASDDNRWHL
jgi:hypothetical protein